MTNYTKPSDINKVWSATGDNLSPSDAKINSGWAVEIPARQHFNWLDNKQDQAIAHINQHGICVWDSVTEYQAGTSYAQGSNGLVYKSKQTHTNQNPVTDVTQTYWQPAFTEGQLINTQVFTASGTYTPTIGMSYVIIEVQGGGGGGGGAAIPSVGNMSLGAPGGGGAYGKGSFTAATIGASRPVTVGAAGVGASSTAGTNGGTSSVGPLISAPGGVGGSLLNNQVPPQYNGNGVPTAQPSGANIVGFAGTTSGLSYAQSASFGWGGFGGDSNYGGGGTISPVNSAGATSVNWGAGGGGVAAGSGSAALAGGNGKGGIVIIWEYA